MTQETKQTRGEIGCGWISIISIIWILHSIYTHDGTDLVFAFALFISAGWAGIVCKNLRLL